MKYVLILLLLSLSAASAAEPANSLPAVQATEYLLRSQARRISADERLSWLLRAAETATPGMIAENRRDREIYDAALAGIVAASQESRFSERKVRGGGGAFHLSIVRSGPHILDPAQAGTITPATNIRLRDLGRRSVRKGAGTPFVFCYEHGSSALCGQPGISRVGISSPATALLEFSGKTVRLVFYDTLNAKTAELAGRQHTLAADFSAPIALTLARTPNRPFDIPGLILTRQYLPQAGLYQFQFYDRERIPVILVHGLFSRPEAWTQVLNGLMDDPRIRERYQFWFFLYPTGLPVWQSSLLLRTELDRFHRELETSGRHPNLHRMVLAGHSMGGLISSLVVRDPGSTFWAALSDKSLDELDLSPEGREQVAGMVKFAPRRDIGRVLFVTTPHRGSPIPHNPVIEQAIRFIQMPRTFNRRDRAILVDAIREDLRGLFTLPANSIRFLKSGSPVLEAIETLPLSERIPYHSIIGDRGRGDTPDSTDGIVPYWSSHLPGAVSEVVIPTDHSAPLYPETTEEIRRILLKNAGY